MREKMLWDAEENEEECRTKIDFQAQDPQKNVNLCTSSKRPQKEDGHVPRWNKEILVISRELNRQGKKKGWSLLCLP